MSSLSESYEHRKIHATRDLLQQDARTEWNSEFKSTTWRVAELIGVSRDKNQLINTTGLWARILGNNLTRAERRKVREMAGLSDVSKIKNHQQRERARASTDSETDDISPDDIMLHAPGWNSNDDERFQDEIARRAEEKKQY